MVERTSRGIQAEIDRGSLEGIVRWPQSGLGVTIFTLESCFNALSVEEALNTLLAPISLEDPTLLARVKKANAQHAHYKIGKMLTPNDIRELQIISNQFSLGFLASILSVSSIRSNIPEERLEFEEEIYLILANIQQYLQASGRTPFLKRFFHTIAQGLRDSEGAKLLVVYRRLFSGQRRNSDDQIESSFMRNKARTDIFTFVKTSIRNFLASENSSDEEKKIAEKLIKGLDQLLQMEV
jgi:hypothetical protein